MTRRAVGILAAISCAALELVFRNGAAAQPAAPGVPVSVAQASRRDVPIITGGIGTVQAFQSVLVRARVDGTVEQVAFAEGQDVKPGDLLALIDPRPYQAAYDQMTAKKAADMAMLANSRRDLARYADLARNDFASRQSVDTQNASVSQSTATIEGDDAAIAAAKLNLDFTRITSPIQGRVGLRLVDVGNLIHANDAAGIVTINQIHPISLLFTLPQDMFPTVQDAIRTSGGTPLAVQAFSSDGKQRLSSGTLLTLDNSIDISTGTIRLKAQFANMDDRLWPGQFVDARLQLGVARDAVTIPSPAVQHGADGLYVYVVKQGDVAALVPITAGQDDGQVTVVTSGLAGNETVITTGQSRLTGGTRIAMSQAQAGAGQASGQPPSGQPGAAPPAKTGG